MATSDDRKKRILEHLARSSGDFTKRPVRSTERRQQILDHVRRTTG